jgi:hypothetical protein
VRFFFGHHRSATDWLAKQVLRPACRKLGLQHEYLYSPKQFDFDLVRHTSASGADLVCYVNAEIRFVRPLRDFRGFHVIRDPRDVVVSGYFSHLHSHPVGDWFELAEHRRRLQKLSREEGLLLEMEFSSRLPTEGEDLNPFAALAEWDYAMPRVLELRFEELVAAPDRELARVFAFLGLLEEPGLRGALRRRLGRAPHGLSPGELERMLADKGFASRSGGRAPGEEDPQAHYRKGQPGDWRNHFGSAHKAAFKERFGDLLIQLGYERDLDW